MTQTPTPAIDPLARAERLRVAAQAIEERLHPAAVLLYGSVASGRAGPTSDVDIAVLLGAPRPSLQILGELRAALEAVLGCAADLTILDAASPILAMQVLRNHRVLAERDPQALEDFVVRTLTDYFDLKHVRRPIEEALLKPRST